MMEPSQVISVAKKRRLRKRKLKEFAGQASPDEKKIKVETIKVESTESDNAEAEQKSEKNKIKQKKKKEKVKKYVVFVGNLAYNTTEEDIKEHFSQTNGVECVRLLRNKQTGKSRGFCFMQLADKDSHLKALMLNESELMGRKINVEFTVPGRKNDARQQRIKAKNIQAGRFRNQVNAPSGNGPSSTKKSKKLVFGDDE